MRTKGLVVIALFGISIVACNENSAIVPEADSEQISNDLLREHVAGEKVALSPDTEAKPTLPALWFEDNNLGTGGGVPEDFMSRFRKPGSWSEARKRMNVHYLRMNWFLAKDPTNPDKYLFDDNFVREIAKLLKGSNIEVALNVGGATLAQTPGRLGIQTKELEQLRRLVELGMPVRYIGYQSAMSKWLDKDYSMEKRIQDIVNYSKEAAKILPKVKFGLICALPNKWADSSRYKAQYRNLSNAMKDAGLGLSYLHLDTQFRILEEGKVLSYTKAKELEDFVRSELGAEFGFIATSREAGYISAKRYQEDVLKVIRNYHNAGGRPDHYAIMSWYPHPKRSVPDRCLPATCGEDVPTLATFVRAFQMLDVLNGIVLPLYRYHAAQLGHRVTTAAITDPVYSLKTILGYLPREAGDGLAPLYECLVSGSDYMLSRKADCEGTGTIGFVGYVHTDPSPGLAPLFRCVVAKSGNHFASNQEDCEGQQFGGRLGFIDRPAPNL